MSVEHSDVNIRNEGKNKPRGVSSSLNTCEYSQLANSERYCSPSQQWVFFKKHTKYKLALINLQALRFSKMKFESPLENFQGFAHEKA